jgi:drug/metabolite transporter (DMT)-like permease
MPSPATPCLQPSTPVARPSLLALPARSRVYVKLVFVSAFWGGTFIAGRLLARALPPLTAATGRFAIAVAVLLLLAWRREGGLPRLSRSQLLATLGLGLTGIFLYNLCFFGALSRMPAGRTALFIALNPIVVALASAVLLRERLGVTRWLGIALAFMGAAVVLTRGSPVAALQDLRQSFGVGELLMLCGICSWAAYTLIGRVALRGLTPLAATTWSALWGLALLACGTAFELPALDGSRFTLPVWLAMAYLGVFGTVLGFLWFNEGVKAIGPSRTAIFNNLVPVFGVSFAAVILGEPVLPSMVAGGALVLAGVALTNRRAA